MTVRSAVIGAALWSAVIIAIVVMSGRPPDPPEPTAQSVGESSEPDSAGPSDSPPATLTIGFPARPIRDFELDECLGGRFGMAELRGRPWVASFVFTRCTATCPQITLAMKELQDRVLDDNPDVMLVTMTVDSEYDTPRILERYSETFSPNRDRWKFLTGDMQEMHELIVRDFGIYVKENLGAARRPGMEVAHSNRVVLVNPDGIPVGRFLGTVPGDMAKLARILSGKEPFPEPGPPLTVSESEDGSPAVQVELVPADPDDSAPLTQPENSAGTAAAEDDAASTETREDIPVGPPSRSEVDGSVEPPEISENDSATPLSVADRLRRIDRLLPQWAKRLPAANALLNATSAALLTFGWLAIRRRHVKSHRNAMIAAFVVSVVFLGCYLTSHAALSHYTQEHGRPFLGSTAATALYHLVLWPHVILAATVPLFAIRVLQHAHRRRWRAHRRLARIAFPVWMYVSVTGVVIYGMLYHWSGI